VHRGIVLTAKQDYGIAPLFLVRAGPEWVRQPAQRAQAAICGLGTSFAIVRAWGFLGERRKRPDSRKRPPDKGDQRSCSFRNSRCFAL
jgi:hypothetical protein